MLWTFTARNASMPGAVGSGMTCRELKGRRPPRSKIEPRSTKNGSSRGPAKTLRSPPRSTTPWYGAYVAELERGPMFVGGTPRCAPRTVEPDFVTLVTEYVCLTLRLSAWFAGVSIG